MLKHFVGTSKEQFFYHNTLLCLVKALEGKNITVDLRNDTRVCGEVAIVDGYMNISFTTAVFVNAKGKEFKYNDLFVQGRSIRYVHIPERMGAKETIQSELAKTKPDPRPSGEKVKKSRKAKKALKLHMETVASLQVTGSSDRTAHAHGEEHPKGPITLHLAKLVTNERDAAIRWIETEISPYVSHVLLHPSR